MSEIGDACVPPTHTRTPINLLIPRTANTFLTDTFNTFIINNINYNNYQKMNRLKQLTRAVRDVRQAVNQLLESLSPRPQPSLVRVPVKPLRSPFRPYRQFSTSSSHRAHGSMFHKFKPFTSFPSFRVNRPFPSGLYRQFVSLNGRGFSTSTAVQNLNMSLRCMFNNGGDTLMSLQMSKDVSYHGSMTQREAPQVFKMCRCESSNVERNGSYVEFLMPKVELSFPSVTFMNSEILNSLDVEFEQIKQQIDKTQSSIQQIFEAYGSLPLERRDQSVRIHFPNLDADELERFLIELGVDEGIVYTNDEIETMVDASVDASSTDLSVNASSIDLSDGIPDLLSDTESTESEVFFPVLSSSYQYASPIVSEDSPVVIAQSHSSFSEMRI